MILKQLMFILITYVLFQLKMSLHDLVETDCGGSNSLVKLSTHFVQDHAFKDQDLKQSLESENNEKIFLEANTGEVKFW